MKHLIIFIAMCFALAACAPTEQANNPQDPYEYSNRKIFAFNETVDRVLFKPVAHTYRAIVPEDGRIALRNAVRNYQEPVFMANALFQGDVNQFFTSFWRFTLNTTLGVGGLYDFAGNYGGLPHRTEDFGQTLAVWSGQDDSAYVVIPLLGPSTTRDVFGRIVDIFLDPFNYYVETEEAIAIRVVQGVVEREQAIDVIEDVYQTSFDPYATIRSAYIQRRKAQIHNRNNDN